MPDRMKTGDLTETGLRFARMHGCGNDFVVIDDRNGGWYDRRAALAKTLGADGVHLDLRSASDAMRLYREARKLLAEDAIVGTLCPPERHLAMEVGEAGADYVGFDVAAPEAAATIAWWGEMMTVPCIAFGAIDAAMAQALAKDGAYFVAPEPELWSRVDPGRELEALGTAIRAG